MTKISIHPVKQLMLAISFFALTSGSFAQCDLKPDSISGKITIDGRIDVTLRSPKKIQAIIESWSEKKIEFPPFVFSRFPEQKDTVRLTAVTEVPSLKDLNSISFYLEITVHKRGFSYHTGHYKFEDINLSLEEWYEKNTARGTERSNKNLALICNGLSSHVSLMLQDLTREINSK